MQQQQVNKCKVDKYGYQYSQKKLIARGSYGSVYLCERLGEISPNPFNNFFYDSQPHDGKYCAIKIYNQKLNLQQGVEFSTLRQLNLMLIGNHPNILSAHQAFFNRQKIQLVMDFHLDLPDIIHEENIIKNQNNKKLICYQITKGLVYLHQNYIMHRDLKPSNIFISKQGITKIGDFGMCKYYGTPRQKFTPYVCTRQYRAPELFLHTNYYTQKADIWSLGCIFYYIFTGQHLFSSDNKSSQLAIITKIFSIVGTPTEQNWPGFKKMPKVFEFLPYPKKDLAKEKGLDENVSRLIQLCINLDPKKRPEAHQLLKHQYFKEFSLGMRQFDYLPVTDLYQSKINNILNRVEQQQS